MYYCTNYFPLKSEQRVLNYKLPGRDVHDTFPVLTEVICPVLGPMLSSAPCCPRGLGQSQASDSSNHLSQT